MSGHLRIGDAERDRAAADLGEHYAVGRLTTVEHAERLDAIWTARTGADLTAIFADLPSAAAPEPRGQEERRPRRPGWHSVPFLPIAAALVALSLVTHRPFWILIFVVGWLLFRVRTRRWRSRRRQWAGSLPCPWRGPQHPR